MKMDFHGRQLWSQQSIDRPTIMDQYNNHSFITNECATITTQNFSFFKEISGQTNYEVSKQKPSIC